MANVTNVSDIESSELPQILFCAVIGVTVLYGVTVNVYAVKQLLPCRLSPKIRLYYLTMIVIDLIILIMHYFANLLLAHGLYLCCRISWLVDYPTLCKLRSYFMFSGQFCSNLVVVLLCCERCIAVYKPFVLRRFGVKSSLLAIAIVVVFSLLLHIWCYQVSEALPRPSGFSKICMPDFTSDNGYTAFVFYIVLSAIVPSVLVASISSAITVQVWRSFSERRSLQNIDILLQSSGKSDQSDSPARRTWSKLARGVNGMKEDVAQSREVRSSLTFVFCALLHTLFYICSAVFWLLYTAQVRRTEAGRADAPSWLAVLCEVSVAMCAVPHCLKSSVILRRTSRARACYDTSVAVRSSHYSCA